MTAAALLAELLECGLEPEVTADGKGIAVNAGLLTDAQRQAIRDHKEELIGAIMAAVPVTTAADLWACLCGSAKCEPGACTFMARRAFFQWRGAAPRDADDAAETLAQRDQGDDERRMCLECRHLRGTGPHRCGNPRAAGLLSGDLPRALVHTLQRCHGHKAADLPMGARVDDVPPAPERDAAPLPAVEARDASAWREQDRAYLTHHAGCTTCKCAGRGYGARCAEGAQLWSAYAAAAAAAGLQ